MLTSRRVLAAALAASVLTLGASALPSETFAQPNSGGSGNASSRKPKVGCKIPGTKITLPRGGRQISVQTIDGTRTRDAYYCRTNGTLCYYSYYNGKLTKKSCTAARVVTPTDPRDPTQTPTSVTSMQGPEPQTSTQPGSPPAGAIKNVAGTAGAINVAPATGGATTQKPPSVGARVLGSGMAIAAS